MNLFERVISKRVELERICVRRSVRRLELFGSAATGDDQDSSDLDFLVEFKQLPFGCLADAFFGLHEDLEELFPRKVDLVEEKVITNPYFLDNIGASRKLLYAG